MRAALSIAANDLRRLYTNVMAAIVMIGLIALPCFFVWFNVLATWDPFGNTERLKVAVANADRGHTSELTPLNVNVGDMVLSKLYRDREMDWVITDPQRAVEGAKSGEYYAAIVLPETLSEDMFNFYATNAQPSTIHLYVNEKKNPISPLLVSSGTNDVSAQINASFTRTLSEVSFGLIESAGEVITDGETTRALGNLETRVGNVRDQLLSGASTVDALAALTESSVPLVEGAERLASSVGANLGQVQLTGLSPSGVSGTELGAGADALGATLAATADSYAAVGERVDQLLANTGAASESTAAALTQAAGRVDVQIRQYTALRDQLDRDLAPVLPLPARPQLTEVTAALDEAIARQTGVRDRLNDAAANLTAGTGDSGDRQEIKDSIASARESLDAARTTFDTRITPQLETLSGSVSMIQGSVDKARADMGGVARALDDRPGSLRESLSTTSANLRTMADSLRSSAATMNSAQQKIAAARDGGDLSELADLVSQRPQELADAFVHPIKVERNAVFPRVSFGAGMAPLYTMLALWVGALLTAVALRFDEDSIEQNVTANENLHRAQIYFGRYLTFAATGLIQSTLIVAGLIAYVELEPAHSFLLYVAAWVSSLVYHLICYSLVLALSNAGKAIGVLILVLQVSAAGGAYPLPLLPGWVQALSPWLPATYSIAAMRAAIFGTYEGDFLTALGMLLLFALPFLLLGLVLREKLRPAIAKMDGAVAKTKVMMT
ncbi:YhgE/Pip domain-containing protein [Corynebacterium mayonis]|uniref:YhgE/Pip domain-containing protein n=1 Tax=Corynebacterium mayonis TaxID=3062461 RepID=UPI0031404066